MNARIDSRSPASAGFALAGFAGLLFAGAACADDPVSYSAPVGISLQARSGDVVDGKLFDDKNINTESGNPYAAFIADAKLALDGKQPTSLEVEQLELTLLPTSTNVTALGEIFTGDLDIAFVMNDTGTELAVGHGTFSATTAATATLDTSMSSSELSAEDYATLVGGNFKVVLRGTSADGFAAKNADANLEAKFTFLAFE